jgi:hypothetical protein
MHALSFGVRFDLSCHCIYNAWQKISPTFAEARKTQIKIERLVALKLLTGKNVPLTIPTTGWSGITPLRKLHSIAVTLRSSAILHSSFKEEVGVCLGIDNDTRWNSWFKVIDTAIAKRPKIVNWLAKNSSHFGANNLDVEDWELLGKTHSFLQPFNQATLMTEKRDSSLSQAIMVMDALMLHFK